MAARGGDELVGGCTRVGDELGTMNIQGSNVLLTGGSQGLGPIIAAGLIEQGANLALVARSRDKLESVAQQLQRPGQKVVAVPADLCASDFAPDLVERCRQQLGPIDIVIHNAGLENGGSFVKRSAAEIEQVIQTNLLAPLQLTRCLLPEMLERGQGHIVTVASLAGKMALPYAATYSASKAALLAWSASLRVELRNTGVGCSLVTPGFIAETGMFAAHGSQAPSYLGQKRPQDVARAVLLAISENRHEVVVSARPNKPLQVDRKSVV